MRRFDSYRVHSAMKALSKNRPEFMVLNLKRWPVALDRALKIEAARRDLPKYVLIEKAVEHYLKLCGTEVKQGTPRNFLKR
jgi:hypothetical protein